MKTSEASKGRWAEIFEYFGLPPITGKNHFKGECPACGARGKFRIDDHDGKHLGNHQQHVHEEIPGTGWR